MTEEQKIESLPKDVMAKTVSLDFRDPNGKPEQTTGVRPPANSGLPFALARFFSWISLFLVMGSSVILALFIANTTTRTLLDSQEEYALLLAENLNKQIFRRFTLPVAYASGRVALGDPEQYKLLDEVVQSLLHGLQIERIRIYDENFAVTYSTVSEEVRHSDLYTPGVPEIFKGKTHHFDVLSAMTPMQALLTPNLPKGTFQLRTIYPLSIDKDFAAFSSDEDSAVLGALEIIQDVTRHYQIAFRSQWLIMAGFLASSLVLFILLQVVARQAERILGERMARNRELEAELHQTEKLASMGRMVASIAHEIRNPLGIIRSSAEFLMRRQKNTDTVAQPILTAIYDESCRLGTTVNDFLDYARPRQPSLNKVSIDTLLDKIMAFLGGELQRQGVEVTLDIIPGLAVAGDEDLLYRAFYNIMVNAQQAMTGGSIFIRGTADSGQVVISFQDSGPGFPPQSPEKPLDPFFTTKDNGTGLGLPIVQSIVLSHGGTLELSNAPTGGALITLRFPAYSGK